MHIAVIILAPLLPLMIAVALVLRSYRRFVENARGPVSMAIPVKDGETALDRSIAAITSRQSGLTGMALISDNVDAFACRALSARNAGRSLDLMYYYWKDDLTGKLLFQEVLAAADRGVRVRILLDDMNTLGREPIYRALSQHPNIALRLFNPARSRTNAVSRALELMLRAVSANRRMHNKAWIADGRLAIVGGRNIGDAYFDASPEANFRDMDLLLVGPAVRQTEAIFDSFWNSDAALPIHSLLPRRHRLARERRKIAKYLAHHDHLTYLEAIRKIGASAELLPGRLTFHWSDDVMVVSDPPGKVAGGHTAAWLKQTIFPVMFCATRSLHIISPYFIPGNEGVEQLLRLREAGVDVQVSTNSLAATDVVAVHGAYARYRARLLAGGVGLYELRPQIHRRERPSLFGSSRAASLHTKAFIVDETYGFIGSFNFDPRSISLNTEMGVLFKSPPLAHEMEVVFARQTSPDESFRLVLDGNRISWIDDPTGPAIAIRDREPEASWTRRFLAFAITLLPIESQL